MYEAYLKLYNELGISDAQKKTAADTAEHLAKWQAPLTSIQAAFAVPILMSRSLDQERLNELFELGALANAERLIEWRKDQQSLTQPNEFSKDLASAYLRNFYRQAYLDLPDFPYILLLLADFTSELLSNPEISVETAKLTKEVFIPLSEMLGLRSLYHQFVERSYAKLYRNEFAEVKKYLGELPMYTRLEFTNLLQKKNEIEHRDTLTLSEKQFLSDNKYLFEKAVAFLEIEKVLSGELKSHGIKARIRPLRNYAGTALHRIREGEAKEDVVARLGIRILCTTVDDCYRVLGYIHSLGKPVALTAPTHFEDHIASPKANGYRGLHAAIIYNHSENHTSRIIIEFRILTTEMYWLNEHGIVADIHKKKINNLPAQAWWTKIRHFKNVLARRFKESEYRSIDDLLKNNEIGSKSNPIYSFTPRGEIVLLEEESTPLDYAYYIHTDMGNQALKVEVNNRAVFHNYPLRNGDIVKIFYDPHFVGPDLSWIGFVKSAHARKCIKQGLNKLADRIHNGRTSIEDSIIKIIKFYEAEKNYQLNVTTNQLDDFLFRRFKYYQCGSIEEFYAKVEEKALPADNLAWRFISEELSTNITDESGKRLPYDPYLINLCSTCRPSPNEPILGFERKINTFRKKLVIHNQLNRICFHSHEFDGKIPLIWSESVNTDKYKFQIFRITGEDRRGLLQEVLNIIYRMPKVHLHKVDAQRSTRGIADIKLIVRAESFDQIGKIQDKLRNIPSIKSLFSSLPSPSEISFLLGHELIENLAPAYTFNKQIPYTTEEVFLKNNFYDREELQKEIIDWLDEPPPNSKMIMHGQRRVGKSSLAKYMVNEVLRVEDSVLPVYVDFHEIDDFTTRGIMGLISTKVYQALSLSPPRREENESASEYLNQALTAACDQFRRILIIIDEFNVLMDMEKDGRLDRSIYHNLRSMMNRQRSINWLLIIQDTHFLDRRQWLSAGPLLQHVRKLQIKHLGFEWARKLITEPAQKCGYPLNSEQMVNKIFAMTAGNPYLINILCFELIQLLKKQGRINLNKDDLGQAELLVIADGSRHFDHFLKNLTGIKPVIMAAVATCGKHKDSVTIAQVQKFIRSKTDKISRQTIENILLSLDQEGLLLIDQPKTNGEISIPIGLFKKFIGRHLNFDDNLQTWLKNN